MVGMAPSRTPRRASNRTTPRKPERAVILLRASVDAEDRTTLITQNTETHAYASSRSLTVVGVFTEDGTSGYKPGTPRPGFDAAMNMIRTGQADVLIVWKLDRLIRNLMGFVSTWGEIEEAGGEFASVVEQFDTTTTMGRLMLIIVAAFAEMESEMKRDRAIPFHQHRKRNGLPPGGPRPFGYERNDGMLTIIDSEADILRGMAERVIDGDSLAAILADLKVMGSKDVPMTMRGVKRTLLSPTSAALREYEGDYVEGKWQPIIERDQWEQLRIILNDPSRRTNFTDGKPAYLLTGFIRCDAHPMAGMRTKAHPKGRRYQCRNCNRSIPTATADASVEARLLGLIDAEAWKRLREQGKGYDPAVIAALEAEADEYTSMRADGLLSLERFRVLMTSLRERIDAATTQEPLKLPDVDDLRTSWLDMTLEDQRMALGAIIKGVRLRPYRAGQPTDEQVEIDWDV